MASQKVSAQATEGKGEVSTRTGYASIDHDGAFKLALAIGGLAGGMLTDIDGVSEDECKIWGALELIRQSAASLCDYLNEKPGACHE